MAHSKSVLAALVLVAGIGSVRCSQDLGHLVATPCAADGSCASPFYCVDGLCGAHLCTIVADAGTSAAGSIDAGSDAGTDGGSASGCLADYRCQPGPNAGAPSSCIPEVCSRSNDCPAGESCDGGRCFVPSCSETAQCPLTYTCQSGLCAPDPTFCSTSAACAAPKHCADVGAGYPQCTTTCDPSVGCAPNKCDYSAACVALTGMKTQGQPCTRMNADPDHDDCGDTLYCTTLGTAPGAGQRICQRFCATDAECAAHQRCGFFSTMQKSGVCVPSTCSLFGSDCPAQTECTVATDWASEVKAQPLSFLAFCDQPGTQASGTACTVSEQCVAGDSCIAGTKNGAAVSNCEPFCDATHGCPSGATCFPQTGLPSGQGWCF